MTYAEAVRYMSGLRRHGWKLGNERMLELLTRVKNPHLAYGVAHVTGTKGKGSTTAMIAAILHAMGFHCGGYFSPYVYDLRERVQFDGQPISKRHFASVVAALAPHVEAIGHSPLGWVTEFELKTAAAFLYFARQKARYAAIEVGIGGRLDATNVVEPLVSVITNVDLDHVDVLGDTVSAIAYEKAGIIKPGAPVVTAAEHPDALQEIRGRAVEHRVPLIRVVEGEEAGTGQAVRWFGDTETFCVRTPTCEYRNLSLAMRGRYQCINAACAIAAVECIARADGFSISPEAVREALATLTLPGRFGILYRTPLVIADGAHNGISARALAGELSRMERGRLIMVVGMLRGHDPQDFMQALAPLASVVIATQPTWRRALDAGLVAMAARRYCPDVRVAFPPLAAARQAVREAEPEDVVLITGSFYTVGDVPPTRLVRHRRKGS